jgi:L-amino acid N-acyltransferase YncA
LIASAEAAGIWTIQTGIFPENAASVACPSGLASRSVGRRKRLGRLNRHWRDVLLLGRRGDAIE